MAVYSDHICWHYFGPEVHMLAFSRKQRWKRQTTSNHLLSCLRFLPTDHILQWLLERICWSVKNITHLLLYIPNFSILTALPPCDGEWPDPAAAAVFELGPGRDVVSLWREDPRVGAAVVVDGDGERKEEEDSCDVLPTLLLHARDLTGIRNRIQFPQSITA